MKRTNIACDLLVIGGSTAGCFAANTAREQGLDVLVVDKATAGQSGAGIMASGFWAVFNEDWGMDYDSTLAWINANSSYLNNRDWTERFLQDSWGTYLDLKRWGVQFPVPEDAMADFFRGNIATDEDDPHTHYGIVPLSHRCVTPPCAGTATASGCAFRTGPWSPTWLSGTGRCEGRWASPWTPANTSALRPGQWSWPPD